MDSTTYCTGAPQKRNAVYGKINQQIILNGSGILTLDSDCVLKDIVISVQGHETVNSKLYTSYTEPTDPLQN